MHIYNAVVINTNELCCLCCDNFNIACESRQNVTSGYFFFIYDRYLNTNVESVKKIVSSEIEITTIKNIISTENTHQTTKIGSSTRSKTKYGIVCLQQRKCGKFHLIVPVILLHVDTQNNISCHIQMEFV